MGEDVAIDSRVGDAVGEFRHLMDDMETMNSLSGTQAVKEPMGHRSCVLTEMTGADRRVLPSILPECLLASSHAVGGASADVVCAQSRLADGHSRMVFLS